MKPLNRKEYYLARMAGEDVTVPEPLTREEVYMKGIAAQIEAGSAELPAVTDVDEGKILAVNASGKWAKADAPTELPAVTSDDNGDVLTVVEGAWAKADAPRGVFKVSLTGAPDNPTGLDKTMAEIATAYNTGNMLPIVVNTSTGAVFHLFQILTSGEASTWSATFEAVKISASAIAKDVVTITGAGAFTYSTVTYAP